MTNYEKMISGELYIADDEKMHELWLKRNEILDEFNSSALNNYLRRQKLIKRLFKSTGDSCVVVKPFYCDYGCHITVGENFYCNADAIFLDVAPITIGKNCFIAPRVSLYTAGHPIDKDVRNTQLEYGYPIVIGDDCWIGGSVTINPGVTIGDNVVIGSGSVVTHDIPSNVIAVGNPCRVLRPITEDDKIYWENQRKRYFETISK